MNQEKIHKFMFTLLLHELIWYIFCRCFISVFCLFVTTSLTPLYLEVIYNIYIISGGWDSALGALRPIGSIRHNLFYCLQGNNPKNSDVGELSPIELIPRMFLNCLQGNNIKRFYPRGTRAHWVNTRHIVFTDRKAIISRESSLGTLRPIGLIPSIFFHWLQGNNIKRVGPRGTKAHWVNPSYIFKTGCKEIISRESPQGGLSPIGFIPRKCFYCL